MGEGGANVDSRSAITPSVQPLLTLLIPDVRELISVDFGEKKEYGFADFTHAHTDTHAHKHARAHTHIRTRARANLSSLRSINGFADSRRPQSISVP